MAVESAFGVRLFADDQYCALAGDSGVHILHVATREHKTSFRLIPSDLVAFGDDHFVTVGKFNWVWLTDMESGKSRRVLWLPTDDVVAAYLDPAAKWLATVDLRDQVCVYKLESGDQVLQLKAGAQGAVVAFPGFGDRVAVVAEGVLRAWDLASGVEIGRAEVEIGPDLIWCPNSIVGIARDEQSVTILPVTETSP